MEHVKTLTRIIDRQDEKIKELENQVKALRLNSLKPDEMRWMGKNVLDLDKEGLLKMNTCLLKMLADFNPNIRKAILG